MDKLKWILRWVKVTIIRTPITAVAIVALLFATLAFLVGRKLYDDGNIRERARDEKIADLESKLTAKDTQISSLIKRQDFKDSVYNDLLKFLYKNGKK